MQGAQHIAAYGGGGPAFAIVHVSPCLCPPPPPSLVLWLCAPIDSRLIRERCGAFAGRCAMAPSVSQHRATLQVKSFLSQGARHAEHDRTDEALKLFDKAVNVLPTDFSGYRHRAALYCQVCRAALCHAEQEPDSSRRAYVRSNRSIKPIGWHGLCWMGRTAANSLACRRTELLYQRCITCEIATRVCESGGGLQEAPRGG
jgi:hypothetical protein